MSTRVRRIDALVRCTVVAWFILLVGCSEYELGQKSDVEPDLGAPAIEVSPSTLDFGDLANGTVAVQSVWIANVGDAPLRVLGLDVDAPTDFALLTNPTPVDLDPGQSTAFDVSFTAGDHEVRGWIDVGSDDLMRPTVQVTLIGGGLLSALVLEPDPYDFGPQVPGCDVAGVVTARSVGNAPLEVTGAFVDTTGFSVDTTDLPVVLDPGQEHAFLVSYLPGDGGPEASTLFVESDVPSGLAVAQLVGEAVPPPPVVDLFGTVPRAIEPVYINVTSDIYSYDPQDGTTAYIGTAPSLLYDIAIDYDGYLIGLDTSGPLYRIDPLTGAVTPWLTTMAGMNALTVLPDNRIIMAGGSTVYEVDRKTGSATAVATMAGSISSGDITEMDGALYWTITGDSLVHIDPATWNTTDLGPTGVSSLWGIAWPLGELWAFASSGNAYRLDPLTAAVIDTAYTGLSAYGAAHNPRYGEAIDWVFELTEQPVEDTIEVFVDEQLTGGWVYLTDENAVWLAEGSLAGGEAVEITYEVEPECW